MNALVTGSSRLVVRAPAPVLLAVLWTFAMMAVTAMLVLPSALTLWDRWHRSRDRLSAEPPAGVESPPVPSPV